MNRVGLYTELYKGFDSNLKDEDIAERAKLAASIGDQQSVIDALYENYTGKKPDFDQRLMLTKMLDPQGVNSIIKNENARRQAAYEKQVEEQKAKKLKDEEECNPGSDCYKLQQSLPKR